MSARFLQDQIERKKGEREGHEVKRKGHKESFVTSSVSFVTFVFAFPRAFSTMCFAYDKHSNDILDLSWPGF